MSAFLRRVGKAVSLFAVCVVCSSCTDSHVAHFSVGRSRGIDIWAESSWEIGRGIYYEVRDEDRVVTRKTFFDADDGRAEHTYALVSAEQQKLVGVLEDGRLVIIQDFTTGDSWPRLMDDEVSYDATVKAKWRAVFVRLKAENPTLRPPTYLDDSASNIPAAGKAEIAPLFAFAHHRLRLPEPGRWAAGTNRTK